MSSTWWCGGRTEPCITPPAAARRGRDGGSRRRHLWHAGRGAAPRWWHAIFVRGTNAIYAKYGDTGTGPAGAASVETVSSPAVAWGYSPGQLLLFVPGTSGGLFQRNLTNGVCPGSRSRRNSRYKLDSSLPATARLAAAATPGRAVVCAASGGATTYRHYVGRWLAYKPAPYTCPTCIPTARMTARSRESVCGRRLRSGRGRLVSGGCRPLSRRQMTLSAWCRRGPPIDARCAPSASATAYGEVDTLPRGRNRNMLT